MRSVMSDLIFWDPLGTGKSMCNLRVLSHCLHIKIQGFSYRTGITGLSELKRFELPDENAIHRFWFVRNTADTWGGT